MRIRIERQGHARMTLAPADDLRINDRHEERGSRRMPQIMQACARKRHRRRIRRVSRGTRLRRLMLLMKREMVQPPMAAFASHFGRFHSESLLYEAPDITSLFCNEPPFIATVKDEGRQSDEDFSRVWH